MNKFRKLFLSLIFMFVCVLSLMLNINAEEVVEELEEEGTKITIDDTKLENYSVEVVIDIEEYSFSGDFFNMYLLDGNEYIEEDDEYFYYVKFVNNVSEKPKINKYNDFRDDTGYRVGKYNSITEGKIDVSDDWYMLNNYNLMYVIKCYDLGDTCEVSENVVEVTRPGLPQLGTRYDVFFSQDKETLKSWMSAYPLFPHIVNNADMTGNHELNIKVGKINDNALLTKIANNGSVGYEELLKYAKNNAGNLYTAKDVDFNSFNEKLDVSDLNIINGAFYYVYFYYTNNDGLYRNLDDVTIVMAKNDMIYTDVDLSEFVVVDEWDKFVEKYKNTNLVDKYKNSGYDVKIESTDNSLSVTLTKGKVLFNVDFKYEDGILEYVPPVGTLKSDHITYWAANAIDALSQLKGYDINKVSNWMNQNLTLEKDGIEYTMEEYPLETEDEETYIEIITSFKLDIQNGLKSYNEEKIFDYNFISGENQKYKIGETKELKFEIDGEYSDFENVYVNGELLDAKKYTVTEGSTVVTLKKEYLDTLSNGVHTLRVTFKDGGFAQTEFTIEKTVKNPSTGIGITSGILILAIVFAGIYFLIRKQSKFPKHN